MKRILAASVIVLAVACSALAGSVQSASAMMSTTQVVHKEFGDGSAATCIITHFYTDSGTYLFTDVWCEPV